jgi:DNA polymerase I-like protein with 3'-5' exonuclease and polymerase domains
MKRNYKGELELPATQIKNYPVQSLGADIMSVIRVDFYRRFKSSNLSGLVINTVHDSIVLDLDTKKDDKVVDKVKQMFYDVLNDFPSNFERIFGVEFDLEIRGEMEVGRNMYDMTVI